MFDRTVQVIESIFQVRKLSVLSLPKASSLDSHLLSQFFFLVRYIFIDNSFTGIPISHVVNWTVEAHPELNCCPKQPTQKTEHKLPVSLGPIPRSRTEALLCFKLPWYIYILVFFSILKRLSYCALAHWGNAVLLVVPIGFSIKNEKKIHMFLFLYISLLFQENKYLLN